MVRNRRYSINKGFSDQFAIALVVIWWSIVSAGRKNRFCRTVPTVVIGSDTSCTVYTYINYRPKNPSKEKNLSR